MTLAGARLGAEATLQAHPGRRATRLRIPGAPAVGGPVAVAARLHALGLAPLLREMRRPRRVAEALLLVAAGELEQGVERTRPLVDVGRRIAELAASGSQNREIAQALFVTTATVEFHLRNAYRKLGIGGRSGLAEALA